MNMASPVIDFHVHAFPALTQLAQGYVSEGPLDKVEKLRRAARFWTRPMTQTFHQAQTLLRHLPDPLRHGVDQLAGVTPLANLLVESTVADLLESMEDNEIDQALLIAHPPVISNDFVMDAAAEDERLLAVVNIPRDTARPSSALKSYAKKGAKALKIHPAADGEDSNSERYLALLKTATDLGLPVILHTGCIHSNLLFKDPRKSRAELFSTWFVDFPETKFVLAHMNFHEPQVAMDLVLEYKNVYADTSWQPTETIGEAVRRVGSDRILFGSDWPLLGNNLSVGLQRIEKCVETGLITREDAAKILGQNAVRILNL